MASTYTTIQGDTYDLVAYKLYGDEGRMADLVRANYPVADTLVFSAGTVLTVPVVDGSDDSDLPPWHSGVDNSVWEAAG